MSTRGLVLGKFAPFHRGHEYLVQQAIAKSDVTYVLVYDAPETTEIPLQTRANWIRPLFPEARVIEGHGAPTESGREERIQQLQEAYIRRILPEPVTHFFSSEWYGDHVSRALGAKDVRVDQSRVVIPTSGSAIRANPFAHRQFVAPLVYFDLLHKVVLVGGESTGKSTLSHALARHYKTSRMDEHGRGYWMEHRDADGLLTLEQLSELAREHRAREFEVGHEANRLLFVDTDARTTRQYAYQYHGRSHPELDTYAEDCSRRYDLTVICGDEIPYEEDGTRSGTERRRRAQEEIRAEVAASGAPWIEVRGSVEKRLRQVVERIDSLQLDRFRV